MPYAPGIQNRAGEYLARGLERAGEAIGETLERMQQERKALRAMKGGFVQMLSGLPEQERPLDLDTAKAMSDREAADAFRGLLQRQNYQANEQSYQKGAQDMKAMAQMIDRRRAEAEQEKAFTSFAKDQSREALSGYYEGTEPLGPLEASFAKAVFNNPAAASHPQFDNFRRALAPQGQSLGADVFQRLGMVPQGGQVNPNGSASVNFGPPDPVFPATAEPILTKDGQPTGKATFQGKTIDLSPPNSEGKTLTQSENQMLGALNQAGSDLDNLEAIFKKLGPDWGGPLSGRVKNAAGVGQNPDITAVENAINAATPNLARGVFREVGVLTDEDIRRYKALLPTAYDTDAVRSVKMKQLRARIEQGKKETMDSLRKAGRDVSGFDKADKAQTAKPPPGAAGKTHAQLIDEANAAIQNGAPEAAVRERLKQLGVQLK